MNKILPFSMVLFVTSLLIIFVSSCAKPVVYPDTPAIEFVDFVQRGDSANLIIEFTDGDGDVGLSPSDTVGDYAPGSYFHYNYYAEYYEMMDGEWVKGTQDPSGNNFPSGDTINFQFRIKNLTPEGQNKALKGTVDVLMEPSFYNPVSNHNDTIKYFITIIDRGLKVSNRIETPMIVRQ